MARTRKLTPEKQPSWMDTRATPDERDKFKQALARWRAQNHSHKNLSQAKEVCKRVLPFVVELVPKWSDALDVKFNTKTPALNSFFKVVYDCIKDPRKLSKFEQEA